MLGKIETSKPVRAGLIIAVPFLLIMSFDGHAQKKVSDPGTADSITEKMVSMIQTDVDPEFVYAFEQTKFVPPDGKTLLIMGQTVERITEYLDNFPDQPIPGGWAAYWGITEFKGVTEAYLNESRTTHDHQMLVDSFPNTVVQSALWMVGKWDIAKKAGKGDYDDVLRQYADWAKTVNRPIYLRIGYEFDGPHNELDPKEYVKAYRRIVDLMRKRGVDNIAFVWHSYAAKPFMNNPIADWYPGDEYVDWVAVSVFEHSYYGVGLGQEGDAVLKFARMHKKPVMIAESNPVFGIEKDNTKAWDTWFVNFFSLAYKMNIKAISFINEDWEKTVIEGISKWKDARLYNNEQISKAWFRETNRERYLKQSDKLYEQLGYSIR